MFQPSPLQKLSIQEVLELVEWDFFGMKMPIGIIEPLIDNLVGRYLESLTPELEVWVLHNESVFDIGIVTPTESIELYSFSDDQRRANKYHEKKMHEMCNQFNFGSLSFRPMELGEIDQTNKNPLKIGTRDIVSHCKRLSWWHAKKYVYYSHTNSSITSVAEEIRANDTRQQNKRN